MALAVGKDAAMMETPSGYVTMLRMRRKEEESSRQKRTERRADFMNANLQGYRRREAAVRHGMMEAKLQMMSEVERDVFMMLNEQAQWRHVMTENVYNRKAQCAAIEEEREALHGEHLRHTLREEERAFEVVVRDEATRYTQTLTERATAERWEAEAVCRDVLAGVVDLAAGVLAFVHSKQGNIGTGSASAMDIVPPLLFQLMKRKAVYTDPAEMAERVTADHVSLSAYSPMPQDGNGTHNPLFCSLVAKLLTIRHPTPASLQPKQPTPKACVVLTGPHFTGKSTIAKRLAEEFNLDYTSDTGLVEDIMGELEADVTPADLESQECCDALVLGKEARQYLLNGQTIPSSLLARFVLHKIKYLSEEKQGILFDNVPSDAETFEAVEAVLSGYSPDHAKTFTLPNPILAPRNMDSIDIENKIFVVERPEAAPPVVDVPSKEAKKPEPKAAGKGKDKKKEEPDEPLPPIELPLIEPVPPLTEEEEEILAGASHDENIAGIHRIIHLDCGADEIFKRFSGIRVDVETGVEYHVKSNPPPLDRMPFIAAKDRVDGDATRLHDALAEQSRTWTRVAQWSNAYAGLTVDVDASKPVEDVEASVRDAVTDACSTAVREYEAFLAAESLANERKDLEALYQERLATREQIRKQLAQVYSERGVTDLPPELQEPVKKTVETKEFVMHPATPATCLDILNDFTEYYKDIIYRVTEQFAVALNMVFDNGVASTAAYNLFWTQPDTKRKLVDSFVAELNAMPPGLRRDVQGKEELHLRADTLFDALCGGVDKRREDCQGVIEASASSSAFLDAWGDAIRLLGSALIQVEVERFIMVKQVTATYFGGVKGEPVAFDDSELHVDLLLLPRAAHEPEAPVPAGKGGKDAKKPPPKGKDKKDDKVAAPAPGDDHPPEDHVTPLVERAMVYAKSVVEKLQAPTAAPAATQGKAAKGAKAPPETPPTQPEVATTSSLVLPIAQAELEQCRRRINTIADFIRSLLDLGAERVQGMKKYLMKKLKDRVAAEMRAVNGCVFHLRSCIEEEIAVRFAIHLDGTEFSIDRGLPLVPLQLPQVAVVSNAHLSASLSGSVAESPTALLQQQQILSCLTLDRLIRIVELLKAIAPKYVIPLDDFTRIVTPEDWNTQPGVPPAPPEEVFRRFDLIGCGYIDWREFIVHLLLWSEPLVNPRSRHGSPAPAETSGVGPFEGTADGAFGPTIDRNPFHVDGPNLVQLFDLRSFLGSEPLDYEQFTASEFYFELQMDQQRAANYKDVLWETFAVEERVDPNAMVVFFCADEQPLRGCQKAFAMGAPVGDEAFSLTLEALYGLLHFSACNEAAFGMEEMYSIEDLEALFAQNRAAHAASGADADAASGETVTFQELCLIGSGRILLNNTNIFRRRKFV